MLPISDWLPVGNLMCLGSALPTAKDGRAPAPGLPKVQSPPARRGSRSVPRHAGDLA